MNARHDPPSLDAFLLFPVATDTGVLDDKADRTERWAVPHDEAAQDGASRWPGVGARRFGGSWPGLVLL
jgi:hypothetical protein